MGVFFGTDGLRGKTNDDLSSKIAEQCGNALATIFKNIKILIGTDTRKSKDLFALAFAVGAINAGANVTYVGVCPTAGVSYLTQSEKFDFGVVISASHNPAEYNGIKIFDKNGKKISEKIEEQLEKRFLKNTIESFDKLGKFEVNFKLIEKYIHFLESVIDVNLGGYKIVIDSANGSASQIASKLFQNKGAEVFSTFDSYDGLNINDGCGALHIETLVENVKNHNADFGVAFDGDSDRVIAVDEKGNVVDGDKLLCVFAKFYKSHNKLTPSVVVGTRHTNMGVEKHLFKHGIKLIRTDIGDKYVGAKLDEQGLILGGEQSGHIFLKNLLSTGDGILNGLFLSKIIKESQQKLSTLSKIETYFQVNQNIKVFDKMKVINSEQLSKMVEMQEKIIGVGGRIMVRVSGTEPFVRVMVESKNQKLAQFVADEVSKTIKSVDGECGICVE